MKYEVNVKMTIDATDTDEACEMARFHIKHSCNNYIVSDPVEIPLKINVVRHTIKLLDMDLRGVRIAQLEDPYIYQNTTIEQLIPKLENRDFAVRQYIENIDSYLQVDDGDNVINVLPWKSNRQHWECTNCATGEKIHYLFYEEEAE